MDTAELKTQILQVIGAIPAGRVSTYGDVARRAGLPNHARYVGTVLKNLPTGSRIPWHRVINGRGEIAFPLGSDKWHQQQSRLQREGICFQGERVPLRRYRW
ncbi:MAG: MGMT family protein [Pseudomonadota bacterium]|nr:cysteine methyltransferase [Pseudomonadales bacterium]MDY6919363.1 MGMT family protein [Pseudomonadota bacterium]